MGKLLLNFHLLYAVFFPIGFVLAFYLEPYWLEGFHKKLVQEMPASLFSIMGFVIASAAIVVTTHQSGRIKSVVEKYPEHWKNLVRVFISSASTNGIFAIFLIIFDSNTVTNFSPMIEKVIYCMTVAFTAAVMVQIATVLAGLEIVAGAVADPVEEDRTKPPLRPLDEQDSEEGI